MSTLLEKAAASILRHCNQDERPGTEETPVRAAKAWADWLSGYDADPRDVLKQFEDGAQGYDEVVLVKDLPVYSHCEHHLAPFWGVVHIGYLVNKRILGLSKFARVVDIYARRLQVQERLTVQIAEAIAQSLEPKGVGVVVECRHMCMESRGIRVRGSTTITSAMLGAFRTDHNARAELLSLIGKGGPI